MPPGYDDNVLDDQVLELQPVNLLLVQHLTIHILKLGMTRVEVFELAFHILKKGRQSKYVLTETPDPAMLSTYLLNLASISFNLGSDLRHSILRIGVFSSFYLAHLRSPVFSRATTN